MSAEACQAAAPAWCSQRTLPHRCQESQSKAQLSLGSPTAWKSCRPSGHMGPPPLSCHSHLKLAKQTLPVGGTEGLRPAGAKQLPGQGPDLPITGPLGSPAAWTATGGHLVSSVALHACTAGAPTWRSSGTLPKRCQMECQDQAQITPSPGRWAGQLPGQPLAGTLSRLCTARPPPAGAAPPPGPGWGARACGGCRPG